MPTLTISGQKVNVDDSFDTLSPAQQEATIEEIAKSFGPAAPAAAAAPAESTFNQGLRAAATMGVRGLGGALDFMVDPLAPLRTVLNPAVEKMEPRPWHPGAALGDKFFQATGAREMQPESTWGRIGLAAGTGAVGGGPFGLSAAILSALGGAVGQGVAEGAPGLGLSPDNTERAATIASFAPMGLAPLARGATNFAAQKGKEAFGPALSQSYRENLVGNEFLTGASNPEAIRLKLAEAFAAPRAPDAAPGELVPGWRPTAYQLTGDPGIGKLERTQRLLAERVPGANPYQVRAAAQNEALTTEARGIAPEGSSAGAVRDLVRQRLAEIDQAGEATASTLRPVAMQTLDQAGGTLPALDQGAVMRGETRGSKTDFKAGVSALWEAIDPGRTLTIDGLPVNKEAARITSEVSKMARQPEGAEASVFANARLLGTASKFSDFSALRGNLLQAIREERTANGETPALRRMTQLRSAMDSAISETAAKAAAGDPTLLGRLSQRTGELYGGPDATGAEAASGRYGGVLPPDQSGAGSQAVAGLPGAASNPRGGPRSPAGYQGIPEPPRPQDLIQFLMERGGLRDSAGELRNMDLHKVNQGYFGRLARKNGMPLDEAREIAVEAGYLHRDSDINDLLNALRRNQQGQPAFIEGDPRVLDWLEFERARKRGEDVPFGVPAPDPLAGIASPPEPPPPPPSAPPPPANWTAADAGRYRAAADARREQSRIYSNQIIGPMLDTRGSGEYRMIESRIPNHVISSTEGARAFLDAGGKPETLRDALVGDLRRASGAIKPDGSLNVARYQAWLGRRAPALRESPEAAQMLATAAKAQEAVDAHAAAVLQERRAFEQGAARHFLRNEQPAMAVESALRPTGTPISDMAELARLAKADTSGAATAGLKRAIAEHIDRNFIENADTLKAAAFQTFIARNGEALSKVLDFGEMSRYRALAEALKQQARSVSGSKLDRGGSNTPQDFMLTQGRFPVFRAYLWPGTAAGAAGLATYLIPGAGIVEAGLSAAGVGRTLSLIKTAGLTKTDALRTEALLNPEVFAALMMKATPANRPFIAAKLNAALGRLVGAGAASENLKDRPPRPTGAPPVPIARTGSAMPRAPVLPPVWGSLVPGGALQPGLGAY